MNLNPGDIARMIDLSCVRTASSRADVEEMVRAAIKYRFGHVSVLQSFIPLTKQLLNSHPEVHLVGNVSFPSGSDSTTIKINQAKELAVAGCDEIDMVMNIGKLRSGELAEVESDIRSVIATVDPIPVKVIIEIMLLTAAETAAACAICLQSGASYIKTGTGWADRGTTVQDVQLIQSLVGDRIKIKASGGIRTLDTLLEMYAAGACRFGVKLKAGIKIVDEAMAHGTPLVVP
ncbi:MAG: deoxyribose-phosphate aldolase [Anaerolineales bacterium]|nr:deoxyribose-phosphate aldolase [Anaerolineae bacterium]PWB56609.1 MAG: deoxyribose-phosphate aldolase [Anaerolineales bacterium]